MRGIADGELRLQFAQCLRRVRVHEFIRVFHRQQRDPVGMRFDHAASALPFGERQQFRERPTGKQHRRTGRVAAYRSADALFSQPNRLYLRVVHLRQSFDMYQFLNHRH